MDSFLGLEAVKKFFPTTLGQFILNINMNQYFLLGGDGGGVKVKSTQPTPSIIRAITYRSPGPYGMVDYVRNNAAGWPEEIQKDLWLF